MRSVCLVLLACVPYVGFASDDHTFAEVEGLFGRPNQHQLTTCGGGTDRYGKRIPKWQCMRWTYYNVGSNGTTRVIFFDTRTGKAESGFEEGSAGMSSDFSEELHKTFHEARDAADAVPTPRELGISATSSPHYLASLGGEPSEDGDSVYIIFQRNKRLSRGQYNVFVKGVMGPSLCRVEVYSKEIKTNARGDNLRAVFTQVLKQLAVEYGTKYHVRDTGPEHEKPELFLSSLQAGKRSLSAMWFGNEQEDSELPGGLSGVMVSMMSKDPGTGVLGVWYVFDATDRCMN